MKLINMIDDNKIIELAKSELEKEGINTDVNTYFQQVFIQGFIEGFKICNNYVHN